MVGFECHRDKVNLSLVGFFHPPLMVSLGPRDKKSLITIKLGGYLYDKSSKYYWCKHGEI